MGNLNEEYQTDKAKSSSQRSSKNKKFSTLWDQVAAWYDVLVGDQGNDYHKSVIMPGAWRLLDLNKKNSLSQQPQNSEEI